MRPFWWRWLLRCWCGLSAQRGGWGQCWLLPHRYVEVVVVVLVAVAVVNVVSLYECDCWSGPTLCVGQGGGVGCQCGVSRCEGEGVAYAGTSVRGRWPWQGRHQQLACLQWAWQLHPTMMCFAYSFVHTRLCACVSDSPSCPVVVVAVAGAAATYSLVQAWHRKVASGLFSGQV